ncbi:N-acetylmuramoyl-L-alanine amidase [Pedobacter sp.]|uniref:N-acetylmuramoyl-L-alanine amidase n=1 Tax=Pedobacter sp. TaxID=1411316 RepID=UPI002C1E79CE|nr:N-acetylmuramoyl-L-alanine amidase [Pedobacter sp.]HWW37968.1 N-acetylmuramoyl-L-alanine amidase [Pedobacter sp.]
MSNQSFPANILLICSTVLFFGACSSGRYAATNKVYKQQAKSFAETIQAFPPENQRIDSLGEGLQSFIGTVNFGIRKPNFVIIHHTAQSSLDETIKTFTLTKTQVSAHYVVSRDGKVVQMVNDYLRANHAGVGRWGNDTDLNSSSIGIELDNNGNEPFSDAQINSLCYLLATLKKKYNIPTANFIGHADIAPKRKPDPNKFPWKKLAEKGFGYWYDPVLKLPPADFNTDVALRLIGYDISNIGAAITAFKRHFVQSDITPKLTPADKLILYNLYTKYL